MKHLSNVSRTFSRCWATIAALVLASQPHVAHAQSGIEWYTGPGQALVGLDRYVGRLFSIDVDGSGPQEPRLVATTYGGINNYPPISPAPYAVWEGRDWDEFEFFKPIKGYVYDVLQDGDELIAGGAFILIDKQVYNGIARWNGSNWIPYQNGVGSLYGSSYVGTLQTYNNKLIVGGMFDIVSAQNANNFAAWDGTQWSLLGSGLNGYVTEMIESNGDLIVSGEFKTAVGLNSLRIARWNGTTWISMPPLSEPAQLAEYNGVLVAGSDQILGLFGSKWKSFGGGLGGVISELLVHDGGLIVAGNFASAGGTPASNIAIWQNGAWNTLQGGASSPNQYSSVSDVVMHEGELIVAGNFLFAGPSRIRNIARWTGDVWKPLDSGFAGGGTPLLADGDSL
jgi:hypothetical protein